MGRQPRVFSSSGAAGLPRCANTSASSSGPCRLAAIPHPLSHSLTLAPAAETGRKSDGVEGALVSC